MNTYVLAPTHPEDLLKIAGEIQFPEYRPDASCTRARLRDAAAFAAKSTHRQQQRLTLRPASQRNRSNVHSLRADPGSS